jgi:hypothetical protein
MSDDPAADTFTARVRPDVARRRVLGIAVLVLVLPLVFGVAAIARRAYVAAGVVAVLTAVPLALATRHDIHGLRGCLLRIGTDGIELWTRRIVAMLRWSELDGVVVVPIDGWHYVLATPRAGVAVPRRTAIGYPHWSTQRRCAVLARIEAFDTSVPAVTAALQRHGATVFRTSGQL